MPYGSNKTVVEIACVTYDMAKVVNPILYHKPSKVYILCPLIETGIFKEMPYPELYDIILSGIRKGCNDVTGIPSVPNQFLSIVRTLTGIIEAEKKNGDVDVLINVSSGSSEFITAATLTSVMYGNVSIYTVASKSYYDNFEELRKALYSDGKLCGMTKTTSDPTIIPTYKMNPPDMDLVCGLRIREEMIANKEQANPKNMIRRLKKTNMWTYIPARNAENDVIQKEYMYYKRHYVDKWLEEKWVQIDADSKKMTLTDLGMKVMMAFYTD